MFLEASPSDGNRERNVMIENISYPGPSRSPMRRYVTWLCAVAVLFIGALRVQAEAADTEHQVKAAFLFNFAQFIDWPPNAFTNTNAPICIGILGTDPFGESLDETVRDETIHGRTLVVRRSRKIEDLKDCQMIFVCRSEKKNLDEIFAALKGKPVLTVGETEGFAERGGGINFYRDGNKVRFEINPAVTRQNGLRVSSELLSLGRIVKSETKGKSE